MMIYFSVNHVTYYTFLPKFEYNSHATPFFSFLIMNMKKGKKTQQGKSTKSSNTTVKAKDQSSNVDEPAKSKPKLPASEPSTSTSIKKPSNAGPKFTKNSAVGSIVTMRLKEPAMVIANKPSKYKEELQTKQAKKRSLDADQEEAEKCICQL